MTNSISTKCIRIISILIIVSFICMDLSSVSGGGIRSWKTGADTFLSPPTMTKPIYYGDLDLKGKAAFTVMSMLSRDPDIVENASADDNIRIDIGDEVVNIFAPETASFDVASDADFQGVQRIQVLKLSCGRETLLMTIFYLNNGQMKFHVAEGESFGKYLNDLAARGAELTSEIKNALIADVSKEGTESYVGSLDISVQGINSFLTNPSVGLGTLASRLESFVGDKGVRFSERDRMYPGKLTISERDDLERALIILDDLLSRNGEGSEVRLMIADVFREYWNDHFSKGKSDAFDLKQARPDMATMFSRLESQTIQNEGGLALDDNAVFLERFQLRGVSDNDIDDVLEDIREAFKNVARHDIDEHNAFYRRGRKRAEEIIEVLSGKRDSMLKNPGKDLDAYIGLDSETINILESAGVDTVGKILDGGVGLLVDIPGITFVQHYIDDTGWDYEAAWTDERRKMEAISGRGWGKAEMIMEICNSFRGLEFKEGIDVAALPVEALLGLKPYEISYMKSTSVEDDEAGSVIYDTPQKIISLGWSGLLSKGGFDPIKLEGEYGVLLPAKKREIDPASYYEFPGMDPQKISRDDLSDAIIPTEVGTPDKQFIFNNNFLRLMARLYSRLSGDNGEVLLYERGKGSRGEDNQRWKVRQLEEDGAPSLGSIWDGIRYGIAIHNVRGHFPINEWGFAVMNKDENIAQGIRGGKHLYGNLLGLMYYWIVLVEAETDDPVSRAESFMANRHNRALFSMLSEKQRHNLPLHLLVLHSQRLEMGPEGNPFMPWPEMVKVNDTKDSVEDRISRKYPDAVIRNEGKADSPGSDIYAKVFNNLFSSRSGYSDIWSTLNNIDDGSMEEGDVEAVYEDLFALGLANKAVVDGIYQRVPMTTEDKDFVLSTFSGADLSNEAARAGVFGKILERFEGESAKALFEMVKAHSARVDSAKGSSGKKLVALGTDFIKTAPAAENDLQRLLQIIRKFSNDSVEFIVQKGNETDAEFASKVVSMTAREKDAFNPENVLVMVGVDNVLIPEYEAIRSGMILEQGQKTASFVGVNTMTLDDESYLRITQMLAMAMGMAFEDEMIASQPGVEVQRMFEDNNKILVFIPKIVPVDINSMKEIYKSQRSIIESL